ncbi:MAG: toll/interleukin-1 receptor domain-containing protein [Chitinophagaceae bacterium]
MTALHFFRQTQQSMAGIKIFISYRHSDAQEEVYHIHRYISFEFGSNLTMLDDNSLLPGDNFLHWIEKSVQSADMVLVMIGKNWLTVRDATGRQKLFNSKDFVLLEIESALKYKKKIIPIILPGANMPTKDQLPDSIKLLAGIKWILVPEHTNETAWRNQLYEIEKTIKKEFPFYKNPLFWVMTFTWPVAISISGFFSSIIVSKLAAWLHIMLPPLKNEFSYFIITGIVWAAWYIVVSTNDYNLGANSIMFLPLAPYNKIVSGLRGFFNSFIFGFPFNILFTHLVAVSIAWTVLHYFHGGFALTFLLAYATVSIYLLFNFSMFYDNDRDGSRRYSGDLYRVKNRYEYFFNLEELKKREAEAKQPKKKDWLRDFSRVRKTNKPGE